MNKFLIAIIVPIFLSCHSLAGVTVLGTRFVIDDETRQLKLYLKNDGNSDFLVKTVVSCDNNNDEFIITPPLFILPKKTTNTARIIPVNIEKNGQDHLCQLSIAAIPKTAQEQTNSVLFAVRSNLHLIYRHDKLENANLAQIKLVKKADNQFYLLNNTNFVLFLMISLHENDGVSVKKTLAPGQTLPAIMCKNAPCNLSISILNDDQSVIKKISLSAL